MREPLAVSSSFLLHLSPPSPTPLLLLRGYIPPPARIRPFPAGPSDRITSFSSSSRRLVLYLGQECWCLGVAGVCFVHVCLFAFGHCHFCCSSHSVQEWEGH
ncbi:uncharacterized protein BO80DRAFT_99725 [Aspergillus ibericus CBS 121593]|uniref:Uncharacterized protein n=1 Tax=Aspergillus ibericus CBS 121593 TaxID=1448316 RepID=A0A395GZG4_9EURO|nr:hypothetical protein BO80DRAFT_99725 [Aspergillus ibericus CBS 121593]RAL00479.1 hypothetical protein BO80DRAFT_99725 [Aspergillus ibericus CBS 121593]